MDIGDVGRLAEGHPGVKRKGTEARPKWYVDDRLVVRWLDPGAVVVRAGFAGRERLLADHPDTFGVPPRFEAHRMVVVELDRADPTAVARAIDEAVTLQRRAGRLGVPVILGGHALVHCDDVRLHRSRHRTAYAP